MLRKFYLEKVLSSFSINPICAILGPRQVGKTTLARQFAKDYYSNQKVEFFDLEYEPDLARLENPTLTLQRYADYLIVIDEIQRRPDLFPTLRVLVDDPEKKYRFLILGSASRELLKQSSETLAGRISYIELPPFSLIETNDVDRLWLRGGFPKPFLAESDEQSFQWRREYISTFLERDIPNLGFEIPAQQLRKFWMMLAFYHGQTFNASEIAHGLMLTDKTVTRYLDILAGTFMVRPLFPWHENIKKRQVKASKIYFRDSGILNTLLGIHSITELDKNPKIGALWEGFALEQIIYHTQADYFDCYYWATYADAELDLLIFKNGKRLGFEFKYTDHPKTTKSMYIALQDLKLDHLFLIFPGNTMFPVQEKITACGLSAIRDSNLLSLI